MAPAAAAQVALVTGASRGIGRAIALALAVKGFRVVGTATTEGGAAAISEALAAHPGSRGISLDVTDGDAWETTDSGNTVSPEQEMIRAGDVHRDYALNTGIVKAFHGMLMSAVKV